MERERRENVTAETRHTYMGNEVPQPWLRVLLHVPSYPWALGKGRNMNFYEVLQRRREHLEYEGAGGRTWANNVGIRRLRIIHE